MGERWAGAGESWPAESHSSCWGSQAGCDQEGHGLSRMNILGCPGIPQSEPDSGNSSYSCRSKEFSKCTAQKAVLVTCWGFLLSCHHLLSRQRMQRKRQDVFSCFCLVLFVWKWNGMMIASSTYLGITGSCSVRRVKEKKEVSVT